MSIRQKICAFAITIPIIILVLSGCSRALRTQEPASQNDLGAQIGSLAEVPFPAYIAVEGYGLVGGLRGAGSSDCPPEIRVYLSQYILSKSPQLDAEALINSSDTAVVLVQGMMPGGICKDEHFDLRVSTVPGTQTTSLQGGWLYGAELKAAGRLGMGLKVLAYAEGPVFFDTLEAPVKEKTSGYILGGAKALDEYRLSLVLDKPDYKLTSEISYRLNERLGPGTAKAVLPGQIQLQVPPKYKSRKHRLVSLIKSMYLAENPELTKRRVNRFIRSLAALEQKQESEIILEAIGTKSLEKLSALLNSSEEQVRLRAARCTLNLGSDKGLDILRTIALDKNSLYRIEALKAITTAGSRNDASAISRMLLRDEDFSIRLAAYEQLRRLDDIVITQQPIGRSFYLEQIAQTTQKAIFVARSGQPRIALFGGPIYCKDNIFVQSTDGDITINASSDQQHVSIMRKHPTNPEARPIQLKSSFALSDIIQILCEEPVKKAEQQHRGLNISYVELIGILKQMSDKGALQAEFRAGPLPKIGLNMKK